MTVVKKRCDLQQNPTGPQSPTPFYSNTHNCMHTHTHTFLSILPSFRPSFLPPSPPSFLPSFHFFLPCSFPPFLPFVLPPLQGRVKCIGYCIWFTISFVYKYWVHPTPNRQYFPTKITYSALEMTPKFKNILDLSTDGPTEQGEGSRVRDLNFINLCCCLGANMCNH